jgi:predicted nucleic acid-binding Zn ribbon protein
MRLNRPKTYRRYRKNALQIGELLKKYLKHHGIDKLLRFQKIYEFWSKAVGEELAKQTRVVALRRNVLTIEVASSPLLAELAGYRKHELLESLRRCLAEAKRKQYIDDLVFKLGRF